jgi:hypothetical protein
MGSGLVALFVDEARLKEAHLFLKYCFEQAFWIL